MEDLQTRLNKLTNTSNYTLKPNIIKEILEEYKIQMSKRDIFNQAVEIDEKHHSVHVKFENIIKIIDEFLENEKLIVKYTPNMITDGFGNLAVSYNGDPYITLRLLLMSIRTHNNIVFFSKKYYAINMKIVETLNMIIKQKGYAEKIAMVEFNLIDGIILNLQTFFNKMIFIGDKRDYVQMKKKFVIPTIYSGYGNVDVFIENKEFKSILLDINQFANDNNIKINYYDDTQIEDTLMFINKFELTDCFVLFSKNTEIIYQFISRIKAKNIFVNKNPFENYKLNLTEEDLIYTKYIVM